MTSKPFEPGDLVEVRHGADKGCCGVVRNVDRDSRGLRFARLVLTTPDNIGVVARSVYVTNLKRLARPTTLADAAAEAPARRLMAGLEELLRAVSVTDRRAIAATLRNMLKEIK